MFKVPANIQKVLQDINNKTSPVSIFLYGSRARNDFIRESDYEVGLLYLNNNIVSRFELSEMHKIKNLRLYPFNYDEFTLNNLDTPFPKVIYMVSLISGAKTLFGKKIVETMEIPHITMVDLLEEAIFQISRAYTAMLSEREGDEVNARAGFIKSVLYGTRTLIILKNKVFPLEYGEIVKLSDDLDLDDEYKLLIKYAHGVRNGKKLEVKMLYKNISFLNQIVIKEIKKKLNSENNIII